MGITHVYDTITLVKLFNGMLSKKLTSKKIKFKNFEMAYTYCIAGYFGRYKFCINDRKTLRKNACSFKFHMHSVLPRPYTCVASILVGAMVRGYVCCAVKHTCRSLNLAYLPLSLLPRLALSQPH